MTTRWIELCEIKLQTPNDGHRLTHIDEHNFATQYSIFSSPEENTDNMWRIRKLPKNLQFDDRQVVEHIDHSEVVECNEKVVGKEEIFKYRKNTLHIFTRMIYYNPETQHKALMFANDMLYDQGSKCDPLNPEIVDKISKLVMCCVADKIGKAWLKEKKFYEKCGFGVLLYELPLSLGLEILNQVIYSQKKGVDFKKKGNFKRIKNSVHEKQRQIENEMKKEIEIYEKWRKCDDWSGKKVKFSRTTKYLQYE